MATIDTITDIAALGLTVGVAAGAFNAFQPKTKRKKSKGVDFFR